MEGEKKSHCEKFISTLNFDVRSHRFPVFFLTFDEYWEDEELCVKWRQEKVSQKNLSAKAFEGSRAAIWWKLWIETRENEKRRPVEKQCILLFPSSPSQMTDVGENFNFRGGEEREKQ